ncbi:GNAT domain-containing protein [Dichotomopilus funicola]|uniref:GNAT domain-containing protein n=1 Tax=Dichotomopilus funicola TaxID=1934379 RepID=A0AAN6VCS6_9PEZI|nr:GNAT domain-containing protein [Dichotomopilus funicola]
MRLNENTAVSTAKTLLVPYDPRHVPTYHAWMEDPAIQAATASEPLTLAEEFENQASWRASHDKLTFIVCQPLPGIGTGLVATTTTETTAEAATGATTTGTTTATPAPAATAPPPAKPITPGIPDSPTHMIGDVNLFLYPYEEEPDEEDDDDDNVDSSEIIPKACTGEIDIMIASPSHRGQGAGRGAVQAFLQYILRNGEGIMREYVEDKGADAGGEAEGTGEARVVTPPRLKMLMAKIGQGNEKSLALFKGLGFVQEGEVNYFGEVKLVLREWEGKVGRVQGYEEVEYLRGEEQQ